LPWRSGHPKADVHLTASSIMRAPLHR
jgi:hypothetical protein